jgi:hypothetical protein
MESRFFLDLCLISPPYMGCCERYVTSVFHSFR